MCNWQRQGPSGIAAPHPRRYSLRMSALHFGTAILTAAMTATVLGLAATDRPSGDGNRSDGTVVDSIIGLAPPGRAGDSLWLARGVVVRLAPVPRAEAIVTVSSLMELEHRELSYEEAAIVVRGQIPGWIRVALTDGRRGWLTLPADQPIIPLDSILPSSLSYLTKAWDRRIRANPKRAAQAARVTGIDPGEDDVPIEIVGSIRNADGLWWHVRVLDYSPCESVNDPPATAEGWIPAWQNAELTAEWYSRGC